MHEPYLKQTQLLCIPPVSSLPLSVVVHSCHTYVRDNLLLSVFLLFVLTLQKKVVQ